MSDSAGMTSLLTALLPRRLMRQLQLDQGITIIPVPVPVPVTAGLLPCMPRVRVPSEVPAELSRLGQQMVHQCWQQQQQQQRLD
jgi:hypothetical protein